MSKTRSGNPKRVGAGLLAGALALFGLALAPGAGAAETVTSEENRLAGTDRYGTAAAIATAGDFDGATNAIVATGENFPDALAGSGLAGDIDAPILLTRTEDLPDETGAALDTLGTENVTILGGTEAVSETVETQLEEAGYNVSRIGGLDRYETAALIGDEVPAAPLAGDTTAIIATGLNFPDALAGGPVAFFGPHPILLVNEEVPAETEDSLEGIEQAIILGGTAAVSTSVEEDVEEITGSDAIRLAGVNRYGTACEIARFERDTLDWDIDEVILATGDKFPDALAAGPLGGIRQAPILLTTADGLPAETRDCLDELSPSITDLTPVGGTAAISEETVAEADEAAETVDNDPATAGRSQTNALDGPELQDCRLTDFDIDEGWIEYTFDFDEDVDDNVNDASFKLYNADTRNPATGDGTAGDDAEATGSGVAVQFDLADYAVTDASLCAVETGAVEDEDGNDNPPQSIAIAPLSGLGSQGADLVSAEVEDDEEGEVIYTFNSQISPASLPLFTFQLVLEDGTTLTGDTAETHPDDDELSTEVLVDFSEDLSGNNDVVRALVLKTANSGTRTVIQAADMGGDVDDQPDLEAVEFPEDNADLSDDEVLFRFDEDIRTGEETLFSLYYAICNPTGGDLAQQCVVNATDLEIDDDDRSEVIATFPIRGVEDNDYIAGAFVGHNAVDGEDLDLALDSPADGEQTGYRAQAGEVAGPQLTAVDFATETNSVGDFEEYQITFTFNKDVDISAGDFSIWINENGDSEEVVLDDCEEESDTEIVCTDEDEDGEVSQALVASVDWNAVDTQDTHTVHQGETDDFPNPEGSFEVDTDPDEA